MSPGPASLGAPSCSSGIRCGPDDDADRSVMRRGERWGGGGGRKRRRWRHFRPPALRRRHGPISADGGDLLPNPRDRAGSFDCWQVAIRNDRGDLPEETEHRGDERTMEDCALFTRLETLSRGR